MVKGQRFLSAALRQENYATIANYLAMELRYMDARGRGPKMR
jgi:hypothetical protein